MKADRLSHLTLALLLAVAACVVLGGATLARRTDTVRVPRDRAPLRGFATAVEEQTRRLERLYEGHLRRIAELVDVRNAAAARTAASELSASANSRCCMARTIAGRINMSSP